MTKKERDALDRSNPFKNKQLRQVLLSIIAIGLALGIGIAAQGEPQWWIATASFIAGAGVVWLFSYLLRHNP